VASAQQRLDGLPQGVDLGVHGAAAGEQGGGVGVPGGVGAEQQVGVPVTAVVAGTNWSVVTSPNVGGNDNLLNGVSATTGDVWAVGSSFESPRRRTPGPSRR
jgi:hypothetical protein